MWYRKMKNRIILIIYLLQIITLLLPILCHSFADEAKYSEDVIYKENIIVSSEELEDLTSEGNREVRKEKEKDFKGKDAETATLKRGSLSASESLENDPYEIALKYIREGKKYEARDILSKVFFSEIYPERRLKLKVQLDILNKELVFSQDISPDAILYTVKEGDTLEKIANMFGTTYELIMKINNKQRTNIRLNERLKILKGPFDILIDKSDFILTIIQNNHYIKEFRIGIGKDNKTPIGTFEVAEKIKNPVWYSGDGVYQYGDPKNILGTRWIGFKDKPGIYGYGIHGTTLPDSIGKAESNGCIRLVNEDVEEVYAFVTKDTKVMIQE